MRNIRGLVFWPTFTLLSLTTLINFIAPTQMAAFIKGLTTNLLAQTQGIFAWGGLAILAVLFLAYVSPFGNERIGGKDARPLFKPWNWFAIALGTTTAVGILFWASAEPIYHIISPAKSLGIAPNSPEAGQFALSTLFMHWTLIPHAIYTLPALLFALSFYNDKKPFSIVSCLHPINVKGLGVFYRFHLSF